MSPKVALECVVDDTAAEIDWDAASRQGGLSHAVLQSAADCAKDPGRLWDETLEKLDRALKRAGVPPLRPAAPELLERAARRAVALLMEDGSR
jgi:hypothetical protein